LKKIGKALITNRSSFELVYTGRGYYFVVDVWLSNFRHGFRRKREKVLRIGDERWEKTWQPGSKKLAVTFFVWRPIVLLRFFSF